MAYLQTFASAETLSSSSPVRPQIPLWRAEAPQSPDSIALLGVGLSVIC